MDLGRRRHVGLLFSHFSSAQHIVEGDNSHHLFSNLVLFHLDHDLDALLDFGGLQAGVGWDSGRPRSSELGRVKRRIGPLL